MNKNQSITVSTEVLSQEVSGETVLLDMQSESYFGLDEVGTRIWQLLQEKDDLQAVFDAMTQDDVDQIVTNIASALPGSTAEPLTIPEFRDKLKVYGSIDDDALRKNLVGFLQAVTPVADELAVKLTLHPDDPPRPLFGLPRIASTEDDYAAVFEAVPSASNGMCFCTGSLSVREDNDLTAIARRFAKRIHFAHLRATKREADGRSFHEAAHLEGDVDMFAVMKALIVEQRKRHSAGRTDLRMPMRPDHGHQMLDDLNKKTNPGYSGIGRLRGLAELRGLEFGISKSLK